MRRTGKEFFRPEANHEPGTWAPVHGAVWWWQVILALVRSPVGGGLANHGTQDCGSQLLRVPRAAPHVEPQSREELFSYESVNALQPERNLGSSFGSGIY